MKKQRIAIVCYLLSFGIVYIVALYYPKFYLYLICEQSEVQYADYCLVSSDFGENTLIRIESCRFHDSNNKVEYMKSHYVGNEIFNKHDNYVNRVIK